jgi:hypothetical protein
MNKLQIDLTVEEANLVLEALGDQPYKRVASLIASIQEQAQQQLQSGGVQAPTASNTQVDEPHNPMS